MLCHEKSHNTTVNDHFKPNFVACRKVIMKFQHRKIQLLFF